MPPLSSTVNVVGQNHRVPAQKAPQQRGCHASGSAHQSTPPPGERNAGAAPKNVGRVSHCHDSGMPVGGSKQIKLPLSLRLFTAAINEGQRQVQSPLSEQHPGLGHKLHIQRGEFLIREIATGFLLLRPNNCCSCSDTADSCVINAMSEFRGIATRTLN